MNRFERSAYAIALGVFAGAFYYVLTRDHNLSIAVTMIITQISYHGSTGTTNLEEKS